MTLPLNLTQEEFNLLIKRIDGAIEALTYADESDPGKVAIDYRAGYPYAAGYALSCLQAVSEVLGKATPTDEDSVDLFFGSEYESGIDYD